MSEAFSKGPKDAIPGFTLKSPYSDQLYNLCEKLAEEGNLANGAAALYWHLVGVIQNHIKD